MRKTGGVREIWLIGGYGDVGKRVAAQLLKLENVQIVLAGRSAGKAQAAAQVLGGKVRGIGLDVTSDAAAATLSAASVVVSLVESCPAEFPGELAAAGVTFIETSADADYLARIAEGVPSRDMKGLVVLSVGTSPGLTNILARHVAQAAPATTAIDICVEMSFGRHYGQAATVWFLQNLAGDYPVKIEGDWNRVAPGQLSRKVRFADHMPAVPAIGYGFSDQAVIARTLDMATVRTFVALTPAFLTRSLGLAAGRFLGRVLARNASRYARWLNYLPSLGAVSTRIAVEGFNKSGALTGAVRMASGDQSDITAAMIALCVERVLDAPVTGVVHSDQIIDAEAAMARISRDVTGTRWVREGPV
ncbi:MAG: saccharopine dehydrogenase NADP-binding domain-containing protein [Paracoccaceae bacterium]|nr:saccharopine dehydrogenase NADP-binding domain-containing protein [Paracoccaceae bacterium]